MPVWVPIAIAATQIASNILANRQAKKVAQRNTNLTIAENKKLADLAYQREQQGISEMNKYNAPSSQMERFKEAKLAPQLIYSQGTPGNQTTFAKYNAPRVEYKYEPGWRPGTFDPASNLAYMAEDMAIKTSQGKILEAETIMKQATAEFARTLEKNKLRISNFQLKKLEYEQEFNFAEFSQFFQPQTVNTVGNGWELKPGMETQLTEYILSKYLQAPTELAKTQNQVAEQQINLQYLENLNRLKIAVPVLAPLVDFIKIYLTKKL